MKRISIFVGLVLLLVFGVAAFRVLLTNRFHGSVLKQPIRAAEIVMRSDSGPVSLSNYRGKIVLLYFGYTSCPDICPTALANLKLALANLSPEESADVRVVFISVDPNRDTPESLAKYVAVFGENFVGATGTREEVDSMVEAFGAYYKINAESENNYSVDHTGFVTVIDRSGYAVLTWAHGTPPAEINEDLKYLLAHGMPVSAQIIAGPTYTPVVCAVTLVPARVEGGEWLYNHHCAQCHGADLSGNPAWQTALEDGSQLPPPLNEQGNAWQYSEPDLMSIVRDGRNLDHPIHMPAFKGVLADWEISFVLTYIKSKWNVNQLNYQHGFMTLTPQPTSFYQSTPTPTVTPIP